MHYATQAATQSILSRIVAQENLAANGYLTADGYLGQFAVSTRVFNPNGYQGLLAINCKLLPRAFRHNWLSGGLASHG